MSIWPPHTPKNEVMSWPPSTACSPRFGPTCWPPWRKRWNPLIQVGPSGLNEWRPITSPPSHFSSCSFPSSDVSIGLFRQTGTRPTSSDQPAPNGIHPSHQHQRHRHTTSNSLPRGNIHAVSTGSSTQTDRADGDSETNRNKRQILRLWPAHTHTTYEGTQVSVPWEVALGTCVTAVSVFA